MFDLTPEILERMEAIRNGNDTCIVIGNGPSLKNVPDIFFNRYDTFGANRIYLRLDPTFYVAVNPLVIQQCLDEIAGVDSIAKFIASGFADRIPAAYPLRSLSMPHFAREPWKGIYEGFTVTYVSLQLAYWMGYKRVLLVGVDHRYNYKGKPNEEVVSTGKDPNHFDDGYFGRGFKWHNPDLVRSSRAYSMADTVFAQCGRRILNLTENTSLNVFDKDRLENWL